MELKAINDKSVKSIKALLESEGINATGSLSDSIRGEVTQAENKTLFQIFALDYFPYSLTGRGETKKKEKIGEGLYEAIKKWVLLGKYGIDPTSETAAAAITQMIHSKGSKKFREPELAKPGIDKYEAIVDDTIVEVTAAAAGLVKLKLIERLKAEK